MESPTTKRQYDLCLSFAGEDRDYVEVVAAELLKAGATVFYDLYEQADLWGKDLYMTDRLYPKGVNRGELATPNQVSGGEGVDCG